MAKVLSQRLHALPQHVRISTTASPFAAQRGPAISSAAARHQHYHQGRCVGARSSARHVLTLSNCCSWAHVCRPSTFLALHTRLRPYSEKGKASLPPSASQGQSDEPSSRQPQATPKQPITRSLEVARERTQAVREKVRSSLTGLTPHENIYNLPNFLTVTRLVAAPATAYLLLHDHHALALGLFAYAGITDLVDGWMARKWKLQTVAGSVMDPMADKALMIILTVTLAVKGAIPLYLATLILGRDASLALAALYYRYASLPAPKTFLRYWDFSLPSAEVHPTTVSKYNTFLQLILIGSALALPVITAGQHESALLSSIGTNSEQLQSAMSYFQLLVAGTTAWSGLSYAFLKNVVTILGPNEDLKAKQGARGRAIIGVTFGSCVLAAAWLAFNVDAPEQTQPSGTRDITEKRDE
ncbi:hypothetical protein CKM354_001105600 [Cercospora kikuchii]|uniref:Cardiolipin synthase n=1 Tax=Cercospora kikuchii TaxID=84275 RepID=A0A9P3CSF8_9PEZI|nr:cardiolipin synthase [Cercospora kikuchii]GIZ47981.1 hypothetical protein CKM354_001105600 [Cercospora kikuchii]